jgi:hypothetical protein
MTAQKLQGVYFLPWEGNSYRQQTCRLLLLGESHHSTEKVEPQTMTIDCTQSYADGSWNHKYWTEIMKVVDGKEYWEIERSEFWSKVAFYNYVQEIVGEGPGIAPTPVMRASSEQGLASVLSFLQPTHVLVLAKRLWYMLPESVFRPHPDILLNGIPREARMFLCASNQAALGTWLPHPSYPFNFNAKRLHPIVRDFISTVVR